jgi:hypothetical protein
MSYSRPVGPDVAKQNEIDALRLGVSPSEMLHQRTMQLRNLDRPVPNIQTVGSRMKSYENPTVRYDMSLNQLTPEAVRNSRDHRQTVSQLSSLVVTQNNNVSRIMQDAQLKYGNQIPMGTFTDPRILGGYEQGHLLRLPKRTENEEMFMENRNSQDANLFKKSTGQDPINDIVRKQMMDRMIFTTNKSNDPLSISTRSETMFQRAFSMGGTTTPKAASVPFSLNSRI